MRFLGGKRRKINARAKGPLWGTQQKRQDKNNDNRRSLRDDNKKAQEQRQLAVVGLVVGEGLREDGEGDGVGWGRVVAEAEVEARLGWAGEREGRAYEAFGDCGGGREVGVSGDGVYEVEAGA